MKNLTRLCLILVLLGCQEEEKTTDTPKLQEGTYRGLIDAQDGKKLPFNFEVLTDSSIRVFNAEEVIVVDDIEYRNDSVYIRFSPFEGYIAAKITGNGLSGNYIKESLDRVVPFTARHGDSSRFKADNTPIVNVSGSWEVTFSPDVAEDTYPAKGIFEQQGSRVTGTFRTNTGDYRYLEGIMDGNQLKLSAFDGAHAFLFTAEVYDSTMTGTFYSGNHFKEPFTGIKNDDFELEDPNNLTFIKEGYDGLDFSFPNLEGDTVSLSDEHFEDKVVVVQIMGSWCPNCLDESRYLSEYYKTTDKDKVEFVALAFEYAKTKKKAVEGLRGLKERLGIQYPILLAQYGSSSKKEAQEKLPMLNHVLSYPTTILIDKKGKVRKIHTGFNGPATGDKYVEFKNEFDSLLSQLQAE